MSEWPGIAGGRPMFAGEAAATGVELWTITGAAPRTSDDTASVTTVLAVTVDVLAHDSDSDGRLLARTVRITQGP